MQNMKKIGKNRISKPWKLVEFIFYFDNLKKGN